MSQTAHPGSRASTWARALAAVLLALVCLSPEAFARQAQSQADVLVVDSVTRAPISDITVETYLQADATLVGTSTTGSSGTTRIGPLPAGTYTLVAYRPGNGGSVLSNVVLPVPRGQTVLIAVDPGSDPWLGSAPLPAGMLAVQVRTENTALAPAPDNSQPIILASVSLTPELPGQPTRSARGDRNGWVVFRDVAPGIYRLRGEARNGAAEYSDQLVITFNSGPGQKVTFPLEQTNAVPAPPGPPGAGAIDGRVLAFDGTPLAMATVRVFQGSSSRVLSTTVTNDRGEFVVPNLTPGTYRLDTLLGSSRVVIRTSVASGVASPALLRATSPGAVPRLGSIAGSVSALFPGRFQELLPGATVRLSPLFTGGPTLEVLANDIGEFAFGGLPEGRYRLTATRANAGAAETTIDLRPGQARTGSGVLIQNADPAGLAPAGVFEGAVLVSTRSGSQPLPGTRVRILPLRGSEPIAELVTGSRGEFRFEGLPSGKLRVVLIHTSTRSLTLDMPQTHGRRLWPIFGRR